MSIIRKMVWEPSIVALASINHRIEFVSFNLKMDLYLETDDVWEQRIVISRLEFLESIINESIFINKYDDGDEFYHKHVANVIIQCWDEPSDQNMATAIYYKATSILEGRASITEMVLSEGVVDKIAFVVDGGDLDTIVFDEKGPPWAETLKQVGEILPWYHRPDLSFNDYILYDEDDQKYFIWKNGIPDWETVDLGWKRPVDPIETDAVKKNNTVVAFKPKIVK